jgi:hypothetical protein
MARHFADPTDSRRGLPATVRRALRLTGHRRGRSHADRYARVWVTTLPSVFNLNEFTFVD